jgi:uncharacterized membrane protein
MVAVYHGSMNAWNGYSGAMGYTSGIFTYIALLGIISIIVVLLFGVENLSRKHRRNVLQDP